MNIVEATNNYEAWLGEKITLLSADLRRKHAAMAANPFAFLRATFYRWMQLWPDICGAEQRAHQVLAVGDLHVENFGTWRDTEGRLVWGINDFDEAFELPYTVDLVRLAASAHIAIRESQLRLGPEEACGAILAGYAKGLRTGGRPLVLAEEHPWLRSQVTGVLRDPEHFWAKLCGLRTWSGSVPKSARRAIERLLPEPRLEYRIAHRIAGLGSLGRQRFVAIAMYRGANIAREAKALATSACVWAAGQGRSKRIHYQEILDRSVRAIDPFVRLKGRWIVRRLAPDCCRVELDHIPKERDESKLLHAMGFETANIHLGARGAARKISDDLKRRRGGWLHAAASEMLRATAEDYRVWREHHKQ